MLGQKAGKAYKNLLILASPLHILKELTEKNLKKESKIKVKVRPKSVKYIISAFRQAYTIITYISWILLALVILEDQNKMKKISKIY